MATAGAGVHGTMVERAAMMYELVHLTLPMMSVQMQQ